MIENLPQIIKIYNLIQSPHVFECDLSSIAHDSHDSQSDHATEKVRESDSTSYRSFQSFAISENESGSEQTSDDLSNSDSDDPKTPSSIPSACTSFRSKKSKSCESHKHEENDLDEQSSREPPSGEVAEMQRKSLIQQILTNDVHILGQNHDKRLIWVEVKRQFISDNEFHGAPL